jgi:hypothetical protein
MAWTAPRTWTNGEIVTQTMLNTDVRDNGREYWHEVAYVEFTSSVTTTTGTEAAPVDVVSSGAITYVANPLIIEFFSPQYSIGNNIGALNLWDDATDLGRLNHTNQNLTYAAHLVRRLTPSAASHTYKVRIWTTGGASTTAAAGAGGAGVVLPGYIRVLQKGGT